MEVNMSQWGGYRKGAGRKPGSSNHKDDKKVVQLRNTRGGARANSGAKSKYGEPTKIMRIPESMQQSVINYIEHKGFNLPVYAMKVPMGLMKASIDYIDRYMNLNDLIKHPDGTFFHPVEGDSMEPTVSAGDLAMIDIKIEPQHGDVVLAVIDGGVTLKRYMKLRSRVWLEPDNKKYDPIILDPNIENLVCGVMLLAIRPISTNHIKPFE
jgi:DNA polymerase V